MSCQACLLFEVEFQDSIPLSEDNGIAFHTDRVLFEMEIHANALQFWHVSDTNGTLANMGELFVDSFTVRSLGSGLLEDEQLIWFLCILDQIFTGDDTKKLLIRTNIHGYDFVPLSTRRRHQSYLDFPMLYLLPSSCIKHHDFINV